MRPAAAVHVPGEGHLRVVASHHLYNPLGWADAAPENQIPIGMVVSRVLRITIIAYHLF